MDCLQIFYDNNIIKKRSYTIKPKRTIDEDELCCICEENKPNMMLDCYVNIYLLSISFVRNVLKLGYSRKIKAALCVEWK